MIERDTPGVVRSTYGSRGKTPVTQTISKPTPLGPEYNPWYWNPGNVAAQFAPGWFRAKVQAEAGPDVDVTWNPIMERWLVWARAPRINTPTCRGWRLLFVHHAPDRTYLPLDERLLARLAACDGTRMDLRKYFTRVVEEIERDEIRRDKAMKQDAIDRAMPFWEHSRIKVSGFGPSSGSKFSTYHS